MRAIAFAGFLAALVFGSPAYSADKADLAAWWRGYEAGPFARAPDGRKLRYFCQGRGAPVVVLESGAGSGAWPWRFVQPDIARTTRVCSYDRAGYGLSDEARDVRDVDAMAADLAVVVKAVGRSKPVVLVGHSLGGPIVRQFAYHHPKLVAGMVLVEPAADHQVERFSAIVPNFREISWSGAETNRQCLAALQKGPLTIGTSEYARCVGPVPLDMPADLAHFHFAYGQSPIHHRAILAESAAALSGASDREADAARRPLGAIPLIVLTAGKPNPSPEFTEDQRRRFDALWRQMHWEMLSLSTDGRRRFVEGAGHGIQVDKPQAVIEAVDEVVAEVRGR